MISLNLKSNMQPTLEDVDRLRLALAGFRAAMSRHESAHDSRNLDEAYFSAFEATMWITSIDWQLRKFYGQSYETARDQDEYGALVRAVAWARNRHAHQLPMTLDEDDTPFFGGGKGVVSLSAGIRWRNVSDLPPADPSHPDRDGETAYRNHLEGQNAMKTLRRCDRWFGKLEESTSCFL